MKNCNICGAKIEETFLGKIDGTIVKVLKGEKNEMIYVCKECQKQHKDDLKNKVKI
jgi:ribosome-binding protein aMBF1 (putative translation factor)